jgi:hypothetical protein
MRNMTARRGVVAGFGAAAGALAAAAFMSTAPIASADDGSDANSVDYAALSAPAATYPLFTFDNSFYVGEGNTLEEYTTTYTGTGMPTTVENTITEPTGTTVYGAYDSFSDDYYTAATTGYDYSTGYDLLDYTSATGVSDYFEPVLTTFGSF